MKFEFEIVHEPTEDKACAKMLAVLKELCEVQDLIEVDANKGRGTYSACFISRKEIEEEGPAICKTKTGSTQKHKMVRVSKYH